MMSKTVDVNIKRTGIVLRLPAYLTCLSRWERNTHTGEVPAEFSITSHLVNRTMAVWRYHSPDFRELFFNAQSALCHPYGGKEQRL